MPSDPRGRAVWVVPLLLCAAVVLVAALAFNLAYLDTGGEQIPSAPSSGSPNPRPAGILDSLSATELILALLVVGGTVTGILYLRTRRRYPRAKRALRPTTWMDVVGALIGFTFMGLMLLLWPRIVETLGSRQSSGSGAAGGSANGTVVTGAYGIPLGVFLAGALLVSILAIALFFQVGANLGRPPFLSSRRPPRLAAARAVRAAIAELELGGDVRGAILACYARFCSLLGTRGIAPQEPLTPREIEGLAQRRLAVSPESSDALTSLFEEARYSEHTLGDSDRDRAVASLERIRMDLEA